MSTPGKRQQDFWWHSREGSQVISPPSDLPRGPSLACFETEDKSEALKIQNPPEQLESDLVAVFHANTSDGSSVVRVLSESGAHVIAIVRVFTSKNTKALLDIPRVTVKVADILDSQAVEKALKGVHRAFLCLSHWEKFQSTYEAQQAELILQACITNHVSHLVFSTFEDAKMLREKGMVSQIVPDLQGRIRPNFRNMKHLKRLARENHVQLTHMITSYVDQENSSKSLCLLVGENGKLIVADYSKGE
jgi:putative NADH-flavin reductase